MVPNWLHILSVIALLAGFASAGVIAIDEIRHPQGMWIMNIVWPVVALFGTVLSVWSYFAYGRLGTKQAMQRAKAANKEPQISQRLSRSSSPREQAIAEAAARWETFAPNGWPSPFRQLPSG